MISTVLKNKSKQCISHSPTLTASGGPTYKTAGLSSITRSPFSVILARNFGRALLNVERISLVAFFRFNARDFFRIKNGIKVTKVIPPNPNNAFCAARIFIYVHPASAVKCNAQRRANMRSTIYKMRQRELHARTHATYTMYVVHNCGCAYACV